jgi:hypothetical protein
LKKAHLLRCASITSLQRIGKYASARRFSRAPRIWPLLNSLEAEFFNVLTEFERSRLTLHFLPCFTVLFIALGAAARRHGSKKQKEM